MDLIYGFGIEELDAALDCAWLFDLGQGDLVRARAAAETAVAREVSFRSVLARGAVHQLQGEMQSALACFEQANMLAVTEEERGIAAAFGYPCAHQAKGMSADGSTRLSHLLADPTTMRDFILWLTRWNETKEAPYQGSNGLVRQALYRLFVLGPDLETSALLSEPNAPLPYVFEPAADNLGLAGACVDLSLARMLGFWGRVDEMKALVISIPAKHALPEGSVGSRIFTAKAWLQVGRALVNQAMQCLPEALGRSRANRSELPPQERAAHLAAAQQLFGAMSEEMERLGAMRGALEAELALGGVSLLEGRPREAATRYASVVARAERAGDLVRRDLAQLGLAMASCGTGETFQTIRLAGDQVARRMAANERFVMLSELILVVCRAAQTRSDAAPDEALRLATLAESMLVHAPQPERSRALAVTRARVALAANAPADAALFLRGAELNLASDGSETLAALNAAENHLMQVFALAVTADSPERLTHLAGQARALAKSTGVAAPPGQDLAAFLESAVRGARIDLEATEGKVRMAAAIAAMQLALTANRVATSMRLRLAVADGDQVAVEEELEVALRGADALARAQTFLYANRPGPAIEALGVWRAENEQRWAACPNETAEEPATARLMAESRFSVYDTLGQYYLLANAFAQAREAFDTADAWAQTLGRATNDASRLIQRAEIAAGSNDFPAACALAAAAERALDSQTLSAADMPLASAGGSRLSADVRGSSVSVLSAAGEWAQAFDVAERDRAGLLMRLRQTRLGLGTSSALRTLVRARARIEALTSELAFAHQEQHADRVAPLSAELAQAAAVREQALAEMVHGEPDAPKSSISGAPRERLRSLEEIRRTLPPRTLLIAYHWQRRALHGWAVTNAGIVGHFQMRTPLPPLALRAIRKWAELLEDGGSSSSEELGELLLGPFSAAVAAAEQILFVPHGPLWGAPLHLLPLLGRPLISTKTVSYLFAASLWSADEAKQPPRAPALVVGDPARMAALNPDKNQLLAYDPLPGTRLEAEVIAFAHGTTPLCGSAATESAVRAQLSAGPAVIHFGTHGYYSHASPMSSGLLLAEGEALTVDELAEFEVPAAVAVLSACESAKARTHGGEPAGFMRALVAAGAREVIGALWEIPDISALLLMAHFHERVAAGDGAATALRAAQLSVSEMTEAGAIAALDALTQRLGPRWTAELEQTRAQCRATIAQLASKARHDARGDETPIFAHPRFWGAFLCVGPNRPIATRRLGT